MATQTSTFGQDVIAEKNDPPIDVYTLVYILLSVIAFLIVLVFVLLICLCMSMKSNTAAATSNAIKMRECGSVKPANRYVSATSSDLRPDMSNYEDLKKL